MTVAVVIPLYNGEQHIRESLDSVCAQTCHPDEIVVVDDGSTDASTCIVEEYAEVRLLENPGNGPNALETTGSGRPRRRLSRLWIMMTFGTRSTCSAFLSP
jgi:hypothetical protein